VEKHLCKKAHWLHRRNLAPAWCWFADIGRADIPQPELPHCRSNTLR